MSNLLPDPTALGTDEPNRRQGRLRKAGIIVLVCLGGLVTLGVVIWVIAAVVDTVESVPVTFVNDTQDEILLPDCGSGLGDVGTGQSSIVSVNDKTQYCSIDTFDSMNNVVLTGCLRMPDPLKAGDRVRISAASPNTKPCG